MVVGPDCSQNNVSVLIPMSNLDYQLRTGASPVTMDSFFKQTTFGCALMCELKQDGVAYTSPAISQFTCTNGDCDVIIASQNANLHNSQILLTVTCTDPQSQSGLNSASTSALVSFANPCFDTTILQQPLVQTTFEANLFNAVFFPLPEASST